MKTTVAIFLIVLVAGATASSVHIAPAALDKNIINDAIELYKCLTESIAALQDSVDALIASVTGITGTIQSLRDMLNACLAIGGENPSLIEQIQQATCILTLVDTVQVTINQTIADVQNGVAQVVASANSVLACLA